MGLSVRAYKNIKKIDCVFNCDGEPIDKITGEPLEGFQPYISSYFPARAQDLEHKAVYSYEGFESFWSSSYGTYNRWREELAKLAEFPASYGDDLRRGSHQLGACYAEGGAFWELCCFSDCDGVIGTEVSKKLAKDFADYEEKAREICGAFYEGYTIWKNTFDFAAEGGAVQFS